MAGLHYYANDPDEAKLMTLYVDLLNYGTAAQIAFNYNVDNLANANLKGTYNNAEYDYTTLATSDTVEYERVEWTDEEKDRLQGYAGTSMTLDNNIILNVFFQFSEIKILNAQGQEEIITLTEDNIDSVLKAYVSYTDHYGKQVKYEIPSDAYHFTLDNGFVKVVIDKLVLADFASTATCIVDVVSTGEEVGFVKMSLNNAALAGLAYGPTSTGKWADLYKTILKVGYSSNVYLHRNDK